MSQLLSVWGGCTPSKVCWAPSEVRCSTFEVFTISFLNGAVMTTECWVVWAVDDCMTGHNAFVFLVGAGTAGYYSSIIGCWDVCVVVGVWSASTVCYSSNSSGEVFSCMGCRRGERCIGYRFSVCFIFLF